MRRLIALCTLLAASLASAAAPADNRYGDDEVVVAMIDSGVRATHQEFDYGGSDDADDQFVAWWDFTEDEDGIVHVPQPGERWHPTRPDPYDDNGHGTATASLAVGRNVDPTKERSFAPGAKLAVARVCGNAGCTGDIAAAIRWATETVEADVISVSIGAIVPVPDMVFHTHEAARQARRAGALVVVANGNGIGNTGATPGWGPATPLADSTEVLAVGGDFPRGYALNYDPELVAKYTARMAWNDCDACYLEAGGTSFSTPLVSGMAAAAIRTAIENGHSPTPEDIETLLKYAARDTETPPPFEGYGVLDAGTFPGLLEHAAAGTLPARPDPDPSALWVEQVAGTGRDTWSNRLDSDLKDFEPTGREPGTEPGAIGNSFVVGITEGERHEITLAPGEAAHADIPDDRPGFDILVFEEQGRTLHGRKLVARTIGSGDELTWRSPDGGAYTLLVVLNFGLDMAPTPYELVVTSTDEGTPGAAYAGQDVYRVVQSVL